MFLTGACATCGARWSIETTAAYARPVCTDCYINERRYEDMKIVKTPKPGTCEAMRCEAPAQKLALYAPAMGHERASGSVAVCEKHAAQAFIDHGAITVDPTFLPPPPPLTVIPTAGVEAEIAANAAYATETADMIKAFVIETREDLDLASDILTEVKGKLKALVARKEEITKPMNAALKSARDLFRPAESALSHAEDVIKSAIATFARQEAENKRKALEAASEAHAAGDTEAVADALARAVTVKNTEGIQVRHVWKFEVTDEAAVPRSLLSVDEGKIRALMKVCEDLSGLEVPGVRFFQDVNVASRG